MSVIVKKMLIALFFVLTGENVIFAQEVKKPIDALYEAVINRDTATIEKLIKAGIDVNMKPQITADDVFFDDVGTVVPLIKAASKGDAQIVQLLLKADANIDIKDDDYGTALEVAARKGHTAVVETLIQAGASMSGGIGPLHAASMCGKLNEVTALLKSGANVDTRDNQKWTPLMYAACHKQHHVIEILVKVSPNINLKNIEGMTALMISAKNHDFASIETLLAAGADPRQKDKEGHNALWHVNQNEELPETEKGRLTDLIWNAMMNRTAAPIFMK